VEYNRYTWQNILNAIPDMIALLDEQHNIVWLNDTMVTTLGAENRECCIGKLCYELVHGTTEPPDYCPHSKFLKDKQVHCVEVYLDKLQADYLVTVAPIVTDGNTLGSVHIARDISAFKKQQRALELSEAKFSAAFMHNPIGMCISQIDDGIVLEVNDSWSEVTGYSREDVIGHAVKSFNLYVDVTARDKLIEQLNQHGYVNDFDLEFITKQGNTICGQMSATEIELNGIRCWVTAYVDKTDAVKLENAIRKFENTILESARDSLMLSLKDGVLVTD